MILQSSLHALFLIATFFLNFRTSLTFRHRTHTTAVATREEKINKFIQPATALMPNDEILNQDEKNEWSYIHKTYFSAYCTILKKIVEIEEEFQKKKL